MAATHSNEQTLLVRFFRGRDPAKDHAGRLLKDILGWKADELENCHDYIQWLFPLPEGSPFNSMAPVVTKEVYVAFHQDPKLLLSLRNTFRRMAEFYGFELHDESPMNKPNDDDIHLRKRADFKSSFSNWVTRFDHNHLRITRIIRSLRVLGLPEYAQAFYAALQDEHITGVVSAKSQMFWRRAAERPLHLPPDEEDEKAEGIKWLKDMRNSTV